MSWWLSGGIVPSACVAAYQSIGAANLAVSYTNLANPGTNDLTLGVAPAWDTINGWTFNGVNQYLNTGITAATLSWSMFVRFSNFNTISFSTTLIGQSLSTRLFFIAASNALVYYANGKLLSVSPSLTSGVLGFAGSTAYRNGVNDGTIPTGLIVAFPIYIGAENDGGGPGSYANAGIQAAAIYNVTITPSQVTALVAAMVALPDSFRGHVSISDQERQMSSIGDKKIHRAPVGDTLHANAQIGAGKFHSVSTFDHHGGVS